MTAAMVTLEMVPLRSKMPHTGRVTLRYALPTVRIDVPAGPGAVTEPRTTTTPQVEEPASRDEALETAAGKGGGAR